MRALGYQVPADNTAPEVTVIDCAEPAVSSGEVLVRVHYAGMSAFEADTSKGKRNRALTRASKKMPVVSGIEMAGVVERDAGAYKQGDRVVGYTHILRGPFFHADYVSLSETKLARVPEDMSLQGAASIVGGALTAIQALESVAGVSQGQDVLVTGATGSVGVTALQLATHLGARVSAVCHSSQIKFALAQGAAAAFAYDAGETPALESRFDVVFDTAPSLSFAASVPYLKPRGTYINTMPHLDIPGFLASLFSRRKWGYLMVADTDSERMSRLHTLMAEGAFREVVDSVYPLARAADAFTRQQARGKRGKILIDFSD